MEKYLCFGLMIVLSILNHCWCIDQNLTTEETLVKNFDELLIIKM